MTIKPEQKPRKRDIKRLSARALAGTLNADEGALLAAMVLDYIAAQEDLLYRSTVLVEEMRDCGGITGDDIAELHGLLVTLKES